MTLRTYSSLKKKVNNAKTGAQLNGLKETSSSRYQKNKLNPTEYQDILARISQKAHELLRNMNVDYGYGSEDEEDDDDYCPEMSGSDMSEYSD